MWPRMSSSPRWIAAPPTGSGSRRWGRRGGGSRTCGARGGVCVKCYGRNLANGRMVDLGEAVGVLAAQSIGEPGTQLTMRTFHIGGPAARLAGQTTLENKFAGTVQFHSIRTVRNAAGDLVVMNRNGALSMVDEKGRKKETYHVIYGARLKVHEGTQVAPGTTLAEWA